MGSDRKQEVTRLLKRGLNAYGLGDLASAIGHWEEALSLDPGNRAARDYLETAYEETAKSPGKDAPRSKTEPASAQPPKSSATPRQAPSKTSAHHAFDDEENSRGTPAGAASSKLPDSDEEPNTLVESALAAYKEGRMEQAWADLQVAAEREPDRLDVQGYIAMMHSERARSFAREVGDQGRVIRVKQTMQELMQLNLTPDEGFLLSQVDGEVTIEQILSLSQDRVHTLQILAKFIREGLVE